MAILYVASEALELEPLAKMLTGLRKLKWPIDYAYEGIWESRRVMLAANGAGPKLSVRAVETAIRAVSAAELSSSRLETIVATGLCGGLDPALRENDVVVGTEVFFRSGEERFVCAEVIADRDYKSGRVVTQDRVASSAAEKAELASSGAMAVDMESAAIAAHASRAGLPFAFIKVVSDRVDEDLVLDFNQMRDAEGRIARGKISMYALTHPQKVPGLLKLKQRAENAAKVLGEFLVSCRISPVVESAGPTE
jgi:nucleoside phosphorylase